MLSALTAIELREAICEFLRSAFPIATPFFRSAGGQQPDTDADPCRLIDDLLARPGALFKGPYLDVRLPFRMADADEPLPFDRLALSFTPYRHQMLAFKRLCGDAPQSTIIATGTGSGKTECFMLPVLEDCLQRRERGIKTIVIYPMNALASDQAGRFAEEVARLDTRLTVGLFVGGEQDDPRNSMGPDHVITDQDTLREHPPDILLTNYKMLDFLLIRPKDQPLWRFNTPGMLRYLVVDELHTFDGAQGTDLACLIRRLRDRLQSGDSLACIGTSATLGSDSADRMRQYARDVFATDFGADAVIDEERVSAQEYLRSRLAGDELAYFAWPDAQASQLDPRRYNSQPEYLLHQARLWFSDASDQGLAQLVSADSRARAEAAVRLGELLHRHVAFHEIVRATESLVALNELVERWQQQLGIDDRHDAQALIVSLLSLIAAARLWNQRDSDEPDQWCSPLLQMRTQLWLRELRRMVCSVPDADEPPQLKFADDLQAVASPLHLPLVHCRECHMAAWGAMRRDGFPTLEPDLQHFYQAWFQQNPRACLLRPVATDENIGDRHVQALCTSCLRLQAQRGTHQCIECEAETLRTVWVPDMVGSAGGNGSAKLQHNCPECQAPDSLAVVGYRAATLTSVMTGKLFATPYNDDYQLIAFSDSVQDAAHRAGYLGANTWRQVVRQALTHWLREQSAPLSLRDMAALFPQYWRNRIGTTERYCGTFIAPDMLWLRDYDRLSTTNKLPPASDLPELVDKRLGWECVAEFGRRSRIGRSLERTGSAAVGLDTDRLRMDVAKLVSQLREEIECLRKVEDGAFERFVLGLMQHMRQVGAIYDPVLDGYLTHGGKEYLLNRQIWMPGFGRSSRPPAAITLGHAAHNFEALVLGNRTTWALNWLHKTLGEAATMVTAEARQVFDLCLQALANGGWLVECSCGGNLVYLLSPERLLVTGDAVALDCNACRHGISVAPDSAAAFVGLSCLRSQCRGTLQMADNNQFSRDYGTTDPRRLVPHEHTGLLPRDERERVEQSFIHGDEPWDVNLLSATPTLEMGIDIGSLSTVLLCSVPPTQANYLQRIGRAGRRDGNALAVTVANGQNHDLYFYDEPLEMIAGAVHTPGVFLQALAVLERQLMAYCFGCWVATGVDDAAIPGQLKRVLDAVEQQQLDRFPYNLIDYIEANQHALLAGFFGLFEELDGQARQYLREHLVGGRAGPLGHRLVSRLQEHIQVRESLRRNTDKLKAERARLLKLPQDEATQQQIAEVERERNALLALLGNMNRQVVLNYFTDAGLLPNYAFPEEGVTLQSVVIRRRTKAQQQDGDRAYDKLAYQFQRPAHAALSELAPENRFYAASHVMPIDQIDLQSSKAEYWRFCDRCQYNERVDVADCHGACPRCGSPQWADSGQKRTVLRLRQVYSTADARHDRIDDASDQRTPLFFHRQMLVDVPPGDNAGGFRLASDALPFGFEFLRSATFREINFGYAGGDAYSFSVAGHEQARSGFKVCKHCGKVQKDKPRRNEQPHAWTCPLRQHPERATEAGYHESLYLYRELTSEAIRVLLPLSEVAYSDEKLHSFIAAINLGLRLYFHGDVHHLEVTDKREPATADSGERVYLVIYDRIPGGTGYLKELMRNSDHLMEVLARAHERLTTCGCIDVEDRDGCYRCILAYRDSRNMPTISRKGAAQLLHDILELRDALEPVASLGKISTSTLIESKLEQRFINALAALPGARLSQELVNGKPGNRLTLPGVDGRPESWLVEHQVNVGPTERVALNTRIDVLLTPARAEDAERFRPIAVYLDGLQYHHDRVDDDVCKRAALLLSGSYWVFSFNWDDLPEPGQKPKPRASDLLQLQAPAYDGLRGIYDRIASTKGWLSAGECAALTQLPGLKHLSRLLQKPALAHNGAAQLAVYRGLTSLAPPAVARDPEILHKFALELEENAPDAVIEAMTLEAGRVIPGGFVDSLGNSLAGVKLATVLPATANDGEQVRDGLRMHLCFDDRDRTLTDHFKSHWRAFWHGANVLQFLPGFSMATRTAVETGSLAHVYAQARTLRTPAAKAGSDMVPDAAWQDVFDYTLFEPDKIRQLQALGVPAPVVGMDLVDASGATVLSGETVELAWPQQCVAIVTETVEQVLPGWELIRAEGDWLEQIRVLVDRGVL